MNDKELAKILNSIITTCLGGPGGDPDYHHHKASALAFKALREHSLPIDDESDTERCLSGRNVYDMDFLSIVNKK